MPSFLDLLANRNTKIDELGEELAKYQEQIRQLYVQQSVINDKDNHIKRLANSVAVAKADVATRTKDLEDLSLI